MVDQNRQKELLRDALKRDVILAGVNLFLLTTSGKESPFLGKIAGLADRDEYYGEKN
ncbi:MAG TPA: hypothetical protein PLT89_05910 [Syntrophomonadaceae bacterium]|nr:hypothetical protein [Syntrophomonadaceae bacterium]